MEKILDNKKDMLKNQEKILLNLIAEIILLNEDISMDEDLATLILEDKCVNALNIRHRNDIISVMDLYSKIKKNSCKSFVAPKIICHHTQNKFIEVAGFYKRLCRNNVRKKQSLSKIKNDLQRRLDLDRTQYSNEETTHSPLDLELSYNTDEDIYKEISAYEILNDQLENDFNALIHGLSTPLDLLTTYTNKLIPSFSPKQPLQHNDDLTSNFYDSETTLTKINSLDMPMLSKPLFLPKQFETMVGSKFEHILKDLITCDIRDSHINENHNLMLKDDLTNFLLDKIDSVLDDSFCTPVYLDNVIKRTQLNMGEKIFSPNERKTLTEDSKIGSPIYNATNPAYYAQIYYSPLSFNSVGFSLAKNTAITQPGSNYGYNPQIILANRVNVFANYNTTPYFSQSSSNILSGMITSTAGQNSLHTLATNKKLSANVSAHHHKDGHSNEKSTPKKNASKSSATESDIKSMSSSNWLLHESWTLLNALHRLQGFPINIVVARPAFTPNWDFASEYVNYIATSYKSSKESRIHYEQYILPQYLTWALQITNTNQSPYLHDSNPNTNTAVKRLKTNLGIQSSLNKQQTTQFFGKRTGNSVNSPTPTFSPHHLGDNPLFLDPYHNMIVPKYCDPLTQLYYLDNKQSGCNKVYHNAILNRFHHILKHRLTTKSTTPPMIPKNIAQNITNKTSSLMKPLNNDYFYQFREEGGDEHGMQDIKPSLETLNASSNDVVNNDMPTEMSNKSQKNLSANTEIPDASISEKSDTVKVSPYLTQLYENNEIITSQFLACYGINYGAPISPLLLIRAKIERLAREKRHQLQNKSLLSELNSVNQPNLSYVALPTTPQYNYACTNINLPSNLSSYQGLGSLNLPTTLNKNGTNTINNNNNNILIPAATYNSIGMNANVLSNSNFVASQNVINFNTENSINYNNKLSPGMTPLLNYSTPKNILGNQVANNILSYSNNNNNNNNTNNLNLQSMTGTSTFNLTNALLSIVNSNNLGSITGGQQQQQQILTSQQLALLNVLKQQVVSSNRQIQFDLSALNTLSHVVPNTVDIGSAVDINTTNFNQNHPSNISTVFNSNNTINFSNTGRSHVNASFGTGTGTPILNTNNANPNNNSNYIINTNQVSNNNAILLSSPPPPQNINSLLSNSTTLGRNYVLIGPPSGINNVSSLMLSNAENLITTTTQLSYQSPAVVQPLSSSTNHPHLLINNASTNQKYFITLKTFANNVVAASTSNSTYINAGLNTSIPQQNVCINTNNNNGATTYANTPVNILPTRCITTIEMPQRLTNSNIITCKNMPI